MLGGGRLGEDADEEDDEGEQDGRDAATHHPSLPAAGPPIGERGGGRRRYRFVVLEFAVVMAVIAVFILVLVGGLELIGLKKRAQELAVDPEKVLAARFASGEIDEQDYARRLSILRLGPPLELE